MSNAPVGERQRQRVGLNQRHPYAGAGRPRARRAAACRRTGRSATTSAPWVASQRARGRGAAADLQHPARRRPAPSRSGVGLAQPLRAPDEVDVAEERAVLGLVVVGVGVPPVPGWRAGSRRR